MGTATLAAGAGSNSNATGNAWTNTSNITADDLSYAEVNVPLGQQSDYLIANSFGFSIPSGATIDGIQVIFKRYSMGDCEDYLVKLIDDNDNLVGNNKAIVGVNWIGSEQNAGYGAYNDDWSSGLTWNQVNDAGFGVAIQIVNTDAVVTCVGYVGYVEITVWYSGGVDEDTPRIVKSFTTSRPVRPRFPFTLLDLGTDVVEAVSAWEPTIVSAGPRREGPPQRSLVILTDEKLAGAGTLPDTTPGQLPEVIVATMRPRERARVSTWLSIVIDAGSGEVCLCPFGATVVASRFATASLVSTIFAPAVGQRASYTADVVSDRFATAVLVSHVCSC